MKRTKTAATKGGAVMVSRNFQITFIVTVASAALLGDLSYVVFVLIQGSQVAMQFLWAYALQMFFPVVLLAVAYAFINYTSTLHQLFNAMLRTVIGVSFYSLLGAITNQLATAYFISSGSVPPNWLISPWSQVVLMGVTLVCFVGAQYWWAHKPRRK